MTRTMTASILAGLLPALFAQAPAPALAQDGTTSRDRPATGDAATTAGQRAPAETARQRDRPGRGQDAVFDPRRPPVLEVEQPSFPQRNLAVIGRSVRYRADATPTRPAVSPSLSFQIGWDSSGSPPQVQVWRQVWRLGAEGTLEFTAEPVQMVANLGAQPNGYRTWTDPAPARNTQNCYFIKAGDGSYWSRSGTACAYAPNPDEPHAVGKIAIRLKLSTAAGAITTGNVRVRLHHGIPGRADSQAATWLDAPEQPFPISGGEATFHLRTTGIRDLSDITVLRVEVPGSDDLCLRELELLVDDATAFRKRSPTAECGDDLTFPKARRSGFADGRTLEIPFHELRNSSRWRRFSPRVFDGTVSPELPQGATFAGFTPAELVRMINAQTAQALKEDGSATGSARRFRNGNNDLTTITRINDREARVRQHLRVADAGLACTIDVHPVYRLVIESRNAAGELVDGSNGGIESTRINVVPESSGTDSGGLCGWTLGAVINPIANARFAEQFAGIGASSAGKPPPGTRFCFPAVGGGRALSREFDDGGLALCLGASP